MQIPPTMLIEPMYDQQNAPKAKEEDSQYKIVSLQVKEVLSLMLQTSHF